MSFEEEFEQAIVKKCRGKKVMLLLTGGMDSRAILSVLVKNNIPFDAYTHRQPNKYRHKHDVWVAFQLGIKYAGIHEIGYYTPWKNLPFTGYDVVLTGLGMTEFINYREFRSPQAVIRSVIEEIKLLPKNYYAPVLEMHMRFDTRGIYPGDLNTKECLFGIIQRRIIKRNAPELLKYKYTSFSRKKKYAGIIYRFLYKA